jgi:hypothetical protein
LTVRLQFLAPSILLLLCINVTVLYSHRMVPIALHNPSYFEVVSFVREDKTNERSYTSNYTCWNFASDFKNNAFRQGLVCGLVYVRFITNSCHTLNCFNTSDRDIVFVEPQNDQLVSLDAGSQGAYYFGNLVLYYTIV